jgi:hypothetical protein
MLALSQAFFCAQGGPLQLKKSGNLKEYIYIYYKHIQHAEIVLGDYFLSKIPIFSNSTKGSRKEWNLGRSIVCQMSLIFWNRADIYVD